MIRRLPRYARNDDQSRALGFQFSQHILKFIDRLPDQLLGLTGVVLYIVAGEALAGAADGKSLVIQQGANLADDQYILALVISTIAAALDGFQLREFLLPIAQHVWLNRAQLTDLAYGEVALAGNRR